MCGKESAKMSECPRCGALIELEFEDGFSNCPECGCEIEEANDDEISTG